MDAPRRREPASGIQMESLRAFPGDGYEDLPSARSPDQDRSDFDGAPVAHRAATRVH
jgi:hypothetical protein